MPTVHVDPLNEDFELEPGESVMAAAERLGYTWPTICGGVGMCTMCWLRIDEGIENASPMEQLERDALETYRWAEYGEEHDVRLGCQVTFNGDARVTKRGVNVAGRAGTYR
jgi:ferredoxin